MLSKAFKRQWVVQVFYRHPRPFGLGLLQLFQPTCCDVLQVRHFKHMDYCSCMQVLEVPCMQNQAEHCFVLLLDCYMAQHPWKPGQAQLQSSQKKRHAHNTTHIISVSSVCILHSWELE